MTNGPRSLLLYPAESGVRRARLRLGWVAVVEVRRRVSDRTSIPYATLRCWRPTRSLARKAERRLRSTPPKVEDYTLNAASGYTPVDQRPPRHG